VITAPVGSAAVPTSVVAATAIATAGEPSSTAVEAASAATSVTTTVLGKDGRGKADEREGYEGGEKRFQQGGYAHCSLHLNGGLFAREDKNLTDWIVP
jgi:hypothetical protein